MRNTKWPALLLAALAFPAAARDAASLALEQARRLAAAATALDADTVISLTSPRVYELSGDAAQARARVKAVFEDIKADGLSHELDLRTMESVQVRSPAPLLRSGKRLAAFLPYEGVERSIQGRVRVTAFYLGLSEDAGKTWRFVDGARLDGRSIKLFLPSYGGTPPLPPRSREKL